MKRFGWFSKPDIKKPKILGGNKEVKELYDQMHEQFLHDKIRDALTTSRKILKLDENHTPTLMLLGTLHTRKKHYDKAAEHYTKILKKVPGDTVARLARAESYFYLFEYEKSLEDYLELYESEFNNGQYLLWLANTYQKLKLMNVATRYYEMAVERHADEIDAHLWLGYHYMLLGRYREADEQAKLAKDEYYKQEHEAPRTDLSNINDLEKQVKQLVKE